jgi:hypothetical protein
MTIGSTLFSHMVQDPPENDGSWIEVVHQISKESVQKLYRFEEIQDGRRPMAVIMDFGTARRCATLRSAVRRWY